MLGPSETEFIKFDSRRQFSGIEQSPFVFEHRLQANPLMKRDNLRELCRYMQDNKHSYFLQNKASQKSVWGDATKSATLVESYDQLESGNVLILLKSVHSHPDYKRLLEEFLDEIGDILGVDMKKAYRRPICTIIIASPRRITPYHMDDAHNLLLQVCGRKDFYVFDGTDPEIVTSEERDAFWNGEVDAVHLTDAKQAKATLYDLRSGTGIHVPLFYPHWVQNGDEVSVAVSMNFQSVKDRALTVHSFNEFLRKRGLHPTAPGHNRLVDLSKIVAFGALSTLRELRRH